MERSGTDVYFFSVRRLRTGPPHLALLFAGHYCICTVLTGIKLLLLLLKSVGRSFILSVRQSDNH